MKTNYLISIKLGVFKNKLVYPLIWLKFSTVVYYDPIALIWVTGQHPLVGVTYANFFLGHPEDMGLWNLSSGLLKSSEKTPIIVLSDYLFQSSPMEPWPGVGGYGVKFIVLCILGHPVDLLTMKLKLRP